jgi:hypothetical protein
VAAEVVAAGAAVGIVGASASLARESLLKRAVAAQDEVPRQARHRLQVRPVQVQPVRVQVVQAQLAQVLRVQAQAAYLREVHRRRAEEAIAAADQQRQAFPVLLPVVPAADLGVRQASCT